jgi:hypothetical protein
MDDGELEKRFQRLGDAWYSKQQVDDLFNRYYLSEQGRATRGAGSSSFSEEIAAQIVPARESTPLRDSHPLKRDNEKAKKVEQRGGHFAMADLPSNDDQSSMPGDLGREALETLVFTPWKVVQAYTTNFIGNTNRPKVTCRQNSDLTWCVLMLIKL